MNQSQKRRCAAGRRGAPPLLGALKPPIASLRGERAAIPEALDALFGAC
jgi:hypothetical protein